MGLDKIFQEKAEKPVEEKKLEVITSDKYVLGEWMAYFESISEKMGVFSEADFLRAQKFFQSFQTSPKLINKFNRKFNRKNKEEDKEVFGLFLSVLMQASYNQGNNGFEFGEINAGYFGNYLKGAKGNPIRIKVRTINGDNTLEEAVYCSLKATTINGDGTLNGSENCILVVKALNGTDTLLDAESCVVEIENYTGSEFSDNINNCEIYTPNPKLLKLLDNNPNHFYLGRMPKKK